jgi:hypothetical protein
MFIDVPTAKIIATFPEGYKYQLFHQEDGMLLIVGCKDQEVIGFIYDGKESKKIIFKSDLERVGIDDISSCIK